MKQIVTMGNTARIILCSSILAVLLGSCTKENVDSSILDENKTDTRLKSAMTTNASATATDSIDNTIYYNNGLVAADALSNGKGTTMIAGQVATSNYNRRAVLKFSLPTLPNGYVIDSVKLTLYAVKNAKDSTFARSFSLYKLTAAFGEGSSVTTNAGVGAAAQTGDATWKWSFYSSTQWGTYGGSYVSTASASQTIGVDEVPTNVAFSSTQMTTDVQNWYSSPSSNYGWIIKGEENKTLTATEFASKQNSTLIRRPKLIIYYHY